MGIIRSEAVVNVNLECGESGVFRRYNHRMTEGLQPTWQQVHTDKEVTSSSHTETKNLRDC